MSDSLLTGWQRAHLLAAEQYVRDAMSHTPGDERARAVHDGLLEVLEPVRYLARRHREQRAIAYAASMWERRSGTERRVAERRRTDAGPTGADEQRRAQRRSGRDRRKS